MFYVLRKHADASRGRERICQDQHGREWGNVCWERVFVSSSAWTSQSISQTKIWNRDYSATGQLAHEEHVSSIDCEIKALLLPVSALIKPIELCIAKNCSFWQYQPSAFDHGQIKRGPQLFNSAFLLSSICHQKSKSLVQLQTKPEA